MMPQNQQGLTRSEYLRCWDSYLPKHRKIIFILESPPKSGLYFYRPDGLVSEPLFRAMMKDILEIEPKTKDEGLREFADRGYLLIDATYRPVNYAHLSNKERNALILAELPILVEDLRKHADPGTKLVLAKTNICRLFDTTLTAYGFDVLNRGKTIPFPSTGQQNKFRAAVRQVLGNI